MTSGGRRWSAMVESAIDAIDTACGSWAWMMSGDRSRTTRAKRKAAAKSTSWAWRQPDEIVALARAAGQFALRVRHEHGPMAARAETEHRQEDLVLSPAPGAGRVDMEAEHLFSRQ